ncbi:hypothetical protein EGH56_04620 [Klebsiella aerogenes]|nr:hypothetical protein AM407_24805 [Klebsiella aerogenes]RSV90601.1 hypothetical protein EGH56_04620 [Klebsiella aerogenes]
MSLAAANADSPSPVALTLTGATNQMPNRSPDKAHRAAIRETSPAETESSPNCNLNDICAFYCLGRTEEESLCLVSTTFSMTCGLRRGPPPGRKRC